MKQLHIGNPVGMHGFTLIAFQEPVYMIDKRWILGLYSLSIDEKLLIGTFPRKNHRDCL